MIRSFSIDRLPSVSPFVRHKSETIGMRKTLVFHSGRAQTNSPEKRSTSFRWSEEPYRRNQMSIRRITGLNFGLLMKFWLRTSSDGYSEDMIPTQCLLTGKATIKLWDLGGQRRFRTMWERYCRGVTVILFVEAIFRRIDSNHPNKALQEGVDQAIPRLQYQVPVGVQEVYGYQVQSDYKFDKKFHNISSPFELQHLRWVLTIVNFRTK